LYYETQFKQTATHTERNDMLLLTLFFLALCISILTHPQTSLTYAALGLELWFQKMIPSLLPFMILSGVMVRMRLTEKVVFIAYPVIKPLYHVRRNVCYAMLMGFLCGFPMGARVVDDLYGRNMITRREAEYLLAFCNNIGPVYFCTFALPLLKRELVFPYLIGMYGIPLLYGMVLRYTLFRDLTPSQTQLPKAGSLVSCDRDKATPSLGERLLDEINDSIHASVQSMLLLGGYMILFNILNLLPEILLGRPLPLLSPLLEITGGLGLLQTSLPLYSLLALSFGGLSCIAQTYSCINNSDLSIGNYVLHKIILTGLNGLFYLCWFLLLPASFLQ